MADGGHDDVTATVRLEKDPDAHVAWITLEQPAKRNAITRPMNGQLGEMFDEIAMDDEIKVLVLRGAGGCFTTGADLSAAYDWYKLPGDERRPSQRRRLSVDRQNMRHYAHFAAFPKVTIAQVEQFALGAGLEYALAADLAVVSRTAKLGMPATRMLGPGLGQLQLFFHRLGPALAKDLLLTGRSATGAELEPRGTFARFVDEDTVAAEVDRLARQVAQMPADGIVIAKEAYRVVEANMGMAQNEAIGYLFHAFATNLRFEPDEFNFVKERRDRGTSEAFRERDARFDHSPERSQTE
jgi:enoyl-CoA hydratase